MSNAGPLFSQAIKVQDFSLMSVILRTRGANRDTVILIIYKSM